MTIDQQGTNPANGDMARVSAELAAGLGRPPSKKELKVTVELFRRYIAHAAIIELWREGEITLVRHNGKDLVWQGTKKGAMG